MSLDFGIRLKFKYGSFPPAFVFNSSPRFYLIFSALLYCQCHFFRRRSHQLAALGAQQRLIAAKCTFIELCCDGRLKLQQRARADVETQLRAFGLPPFAESAAQSSAKAQEEEEDEDNENDEGDGTESGSSLAGAKDGSTSKAGTVDASTSAANAAGKYSKSSSKKKPWDYLLQMPLAALTRERSAALRADLSALTAQIARLTALTPAQLWEADLGELEAKLVAHIARAEREVAAFRASVAAMSSAPSSSAPSSSSSSSSSSVGRSKAQPKRTSEVPTAEEANAKAPTPRAAKPTAASSSAAAKSKKSRDL